MAGRTLSKFERVYVDGYDMSCSSRTIGPLSAEYDLADLTVPMCDEVKGYLPNSLNVNVGTLNGVMVSTTDSSQEISAIQDPGKQRDIMVAVGQLAAPAIGDPTFTMKAVHSGFHVVENGGAITITADFGGQDVSDINLPLKPWGVLLHDKSAETAANSSTTDTVDNTSSTASGGYMMYQIFSGDSTGTISVQSAATNDDVEFAGVDGLTFDYTDIPSAGIVSTTATTTAIGRYTRWQLSISTGTTVTFALALVR